MGQATQRLSPEDIMTNSLNARYAEIDAVHAEKNRRIDAVWRRSMWGLGISILIGLPLLFLGAVNGWIGVIGASISCLGTLGSQCYSLFIGDKWINAVKY